MPSNAYVIIGAVLMAVAVSLGAIGAHLLKDKLNKDQLAVYHTAVEYQMIHSLGLVLIGILAAQRPGRLFDVAAALMVVGIIFFSGFLYAYVATQVKLFAMLVPIGGLSFIASWLAVAGAAWGR